jgi:hypothetical protein
MLIDGHANIGDIEIRQFIETAELALNKFEHSEVVAL